MPQTSTMPYAYFRKEIVPIEQATISIASHSLQYGMTCFAGIRGYFQQDKARIFRLHDHYIRMMNGAKIVGMPFYITWEDFFAILSKLIQVNDPQSDFYIRPFMFSEDQELGPRFAGINFDLAIYLMELKKYYSTNKGLRLKISTWRKYSDDVLPTKAKAGGCYVNSALATTEARQCGYDEALMMDQQGSIIEASVANMAIVYRGEVIMPELGYSLLEGMTRRTIIELLKDEGIPIRFERIDRSMVYTCDELILTGTAVQVLYASSVDDRILSKDDTPGPICKLLRQKYADAIAGNHPKSKEWNSDIALKKTN